MPDKTFHFTRGAPTLAPLALPAGETAMSALHRVLRLPSVCSKRFLTNKVRGPSVWAGLPIPCPCVCMPCPLIHMRQQRQHRQQRHVTGLLVQAALRGPAAHPRPSCMRVNHLPLPC